jgi:hypothetical protein
MIHAMGTVGFGEGWRRAIFGKVGRVVAVLVDGFDEFTFVFDGP